MLTGASWQRCRTQFARNLLTRVPRSAQPLVATLVRSIFAQPSAAEVWAQHGRLVEQLHDRFPAAAELLVAVADDLLAFTAFPTEHWRQIWSNNPLERLHREIRRRTDVVGIFPNRAAVIRLVGAVLAEQQATGWSPVATWPWKASPRLLPSARTTNPSSPPEPTDARARRGFVHHLDGHYYPGRPFALRQRLSSIGFCVVLLQPND